MPIKLGEPEVMPTSDEDCRQAVSALAVMIEDWWAAQERTRRAQDDGGVTQPATWPNAPAVGGRSR